MKRVQQQKTPRNRVTPEPVYDFIARSTRLEDDFHHPFQSRAVDFHQKLHEFLGCDIRSCCLCLFKLTHQDAEPLNLPLKFFFGCHADPFSLPACAGPNSLRLGPAFPALAFLCYVPWCV